MEMPKLKAKFASMTFFFFLNNFLVLTLKG